MYQHQPGQQLVNRPNSVWDWVYVMPPSPFFCNSLCFSTVLIEFGFKSLSNRKSIPRRTPDIGQGVHRWFFPATNYILPRDYCLIGRPVNPVFTNFLIYLTYIISGMILIYSSKEKLTLGVFSPSLQRKIKKKKKSLQRA